MPSNITDAKVESDLHRVGSCNALFVASKAMLYSLYAESIIPGDICLLDMIASPIALIKDVRLGDGSVPSSCDIYGSTPELLWEPTKYLKVYDIARSSIETERGVGISRICLSAEN